MDHDRLPRIAKDAKPETAKTTASQEKGKIAGVVAGSNRPRACIKKKKTEEASVTKTLLPWKSIKV